MENRIWEILEKDLSEGKELEVSTDFVTNFLSGTAQDAKGLQGGKYFVMSYSFGGSVSPQSFNLCTYIVITNFNGNSFFAPFQTLGLLLTISIIQIQFQFSA